MMLASCVLLAVSVSSSPPCNHVLLLHHSRVQVPCLSSGIPSRSGLPATLREKKQSALELRAVQTSAEDFLTVWQTWKRNQNRTSLEGQYLKKMCHMWPYEHLIQTAHVPPVSPVANLSAGIYLAHVSKSTQPRTQTAGASVLSWRGSSNPAPPPTAHRGRGLRHQWIRPAACPSLPAQAQVAVCGAQKIYMFRCGSIFSLPLTENKDVDETPANSHHGRKTYDQPMVRIAVNGTHEATLSSRARPTLC